MPVLPTEKACEDLLWRQIFVAKQLSIHTLARCPPAGQRSCNTYIFFSFMATFGIYCFRRILIFSLTQFSKTMIKFSVRAFVNRDKHTDRRQQQLDRKDARGKK